MVKSTINVDFLCLNHLTMNQIDGKSISTCKQKDYIYNVTAYVLFKITTSSIYNILYTSHDCNTMSNFL